MVYNRILGAMTMYSYISLQIHENPLSSISSGRAKNHFIHSYNRNIRKSQKSLAPISVCPPPTRRSHLYDNKHTEKAHTQKQITTDMCPQRTTTTPIYLICVVICNVLNPVYSMAVFWTLLEYPRKIPLSSWWTTIKF